MSIPKNIIFSKAEKDLIRLGKKRESERIIKLLDESLVYDEPVVIERDSLIKLIKGENK